MRAADAGTPIQWQCSTCGDGGVISHWEDSPYDLRRRKLAAAGTLSEVGISSEVAAALRDLQLLDIDCERLVYAIRADGSHAVLRATDEELDELTGFVSAEANHEPRKRRQQQLDHAFEALNAAAQVRSGW